MDGGFEDQAGGAAATVSSFVGPQTQWTSQNAILAVTNNGTGGRSGPRYMEVYHTGATHYRLQSPTSLGVLPSTSYAIQFYYKCGPFINNAIRAAVSPSGTTGISGYTPYLYVSSVSTWTKFTNVLVSGTAGSSNGICAISVNSNSVFEIDDFVTYEGTEIDVIAPDPPTAYSTNSLTSSSIDMGWTAPGTGVDGGGYLVVRGNSDPSTAPNMNGIYAIGDVVDATGTVVYIGTATSFTDSNLTSWTTYRYRVYTVDKAFNYSTALVGTATTIPEPALLAVAGLAALAFLRRR